MVGVSSDPAPVNRKFRERHGLPFRILSDPDHRLVSALGVKTSTNHPMAKIRKYPKGFSQPAVFVFDRNGAERFAWRQRPKLANLFGAARRLSPEEILEKLRAVAEAP